jgi:hypothetical protein
MKEEGEKLCRIAGTWRPREQRWSGGKMEGVTVVVVVVVVVGA